MTKEIKPTLTKKSQLMDFENCKISDLSEEQKQLLFKSTNAELINELIGDAIPSSMKKISAEPKDIDTAELRVKNFMSSILTGNGLETMIATQMTAVHNLQLSAATYAKHYKSVELVKPYVNMVTKLSNTFIQQAQLLTKLQGKGQQKVTVEHVNVHEGGQAIVGNVDNHPGDENL